MKCIILAAGEGKRMHPLTYTRPKVMLPLGNKPVLELNLVNAIKAGLNEFIFVVGYKSEMVRRYFKNGSKWDVKIEYVNQGKPEGTAHAIGVTEKFVDEDFLVFCGDTVFGIDDIKKIKEINNSIGLYSVDNPGEYGIVKTQNGRLVKIFEKMKNPFSNLINAGIYHFKPSIYDYIKNTSKSRRGEYEITDTINMFEEKMYSVELKEWFDIGYPWHLLKANKKILEENKSVVEGKVEENATLHGKIQIGENTIVKNGSYIEGPVIIGKDCKIGPNCYIRPYTSIGDGCHVGNASEVKNSIILNNTNIPHHNYVGDSVIGENCNLGSGTKIANLRLDEKNIAATVNGEKVDTKRRKLGAIIGDHVETGINSMMNPGTIVGNNVFVGPGRIAKGEIKKGSFLV